MHKLTRKFFPFLILITISLVTYGQYPFEKYPAITFKNANNWKTISKNQKKSIYKLTIPAFFQNNDTLVIKLFKYKYDSSGYIDSCVYKVYRNKNYLLQFYDVNLSDSDYPRFNTEDTIRVADFNGDSLLDFKIIFRGWGCGLFNIGANINYFLQNNFNSFTIISFGDMYFRDENRLERDIDGDGKYEVITMDYQNYGKHNYWLFNLYKFTPKGLINVNYIDNYPIMVPISIREYFNISKRISRNKMKTFSKKLPTNYIREIYKR